MTNEQHNTEVKPQIIEFRDLITRFNHGAKLRKWTVIPLSNKRYFLEHKKRKAYYIYDSVKRTVTQ